MDFDFTRDLICIKDRILPKEALKFFQYQNSERVAITITNDPNVWREDLCIAERLFSHLIVLPAFSSNDIHISNMEIVKRVLKERLQYPNIKENPDLLDIAKIWVLPTKLHRGPNISAFSNPIENPMYAALAPIFAEINTDPVIHYLKIEVPNGFERNLIYTVLDSGFRPSLLLVKWLKDIDDDVATAHCNGHLQNTGYRLISLQNKYALYYFTDQTLYDSCSFKTIGLNNPIFSSILDSVNDSIRVKQEQQDNN
jgi:hypothetical protein